MFCVNCLPYEKHPHIASISPLYSLLFVAPAIWGVLRGKRTHCLTLQTASLLAITMTALTTAAWIDNALWILNWFLLFPAWYLVATARRAARDGSRRVERPLGTSL